MEEMKNAYKILVRKPEGKRLDGGPRCRWVDKIKMDLTETGCEVVDCIQHTQDMVQWQAFVNMVMNLQVPYKAGNFFTS
jgi:hypothetical protein